MTQDCENKCREMEKLGELVNWFTGPLDTARSLGDIAFFEFDFGVHEQSLNLHTFDTQPRWG
jgi:hypothetical protein